MKKKKSKSSKNSNVGFIVTLIVVLVILLFLIVCGGYYIVGEIGENNVYNYNNENLLEGENVNDMTTKEEDKDK